MLCSPDQLGQNQNVTAELRLIRVSGGAVERRRLNRFVAGDRSMQVGLVVRNDDEDVGRTWGTAGELVVAAWREV